MMKNVLVISPYFPPSSMPPVHRVRMLVNYLKEFGWNPIVLTVSAQYYEENMDWELANLLPKDIEVYYARALSVKWTRLFGIGNVCIRSLISLFLNARRICRRKQIDVLFLQPSPVIWIIGRLIKRFFNIPYVVDYQDPWISDFGRFESPLRKSWWAHRLARFMEPLAMKKVDHIVGVSLGTYEKIRIPYSFLHDEDFTELPFGGEPKDFEYIDASSDSHPCVCNDSDLINFVYVGAIGSQMHRTIRTLMLAVKKIKENWPDIYQQMHLYFYGSTYAYRIKPEDMIATIIAKEVGIEDIVTEQAARLKYLDALRVLRSSDVILVFGVQSPHYTASKIYPCILARRPILGLIHEKSLVVKTVNEMNAGRIITYSDAQPVEECIDKIADELKYFIQKKYKAAPSINQTIFEKYSARNMTRVLAEVFDKVARRSLH